MVAVFFVGVGYLMSKTCLWYSLKWSFLSCFIFVLCIIIHPTALTTNPSFMDWLILMITGVTGTIIALHLSKLISRNENIIKSSIIYIGKRTFYIMTFHFLMFKPASLLYTYINGLDWRMIGCHPVIPMEDNWYWVIYSLTSLVLSIGLAWIVERIPSPAIIIKFKKK